MKHLLNGNITLNVGAISNIPSVKLHQDTLVAGTVKLILASGKELTLDINDFIEVNIREHCPETGLPILSDDINYTL